MKRWQKTLVGCHSAAFGQSGDLFAASLPLRPGCIRQFHGSEVRLRHPDHLGFRPV